MLPLGTVYTPSCIPESADHNRKEKIKPGTLHSQAPGRPPAITSRQEKAWDKLLIDGFRYSKSWGKLSPLESMGEFTHVKCYRNKPPINSCFFRKSAHASFYSDRAINFFMDFRAPPASGPPLPCPESRPRPRPIFSGAPSPPRGVPPWPAPSRGGS